MKRGVILLASAVIFLLFVNNCSAIGIGPPRVELNFEPNLEQDIEYMVLNNLDEPAQIDLYVKGDLAEYVTLDKAVVNLDAGKSANIIAHVSLPSKIDVPGVHDIRIGALATPLSALGGTVGAKAGVESQLLVSVPYEGKYLSVTMESEDVELGEDVNFKIFIENKGLENIDSVSAEIDVYLGEEKVGSVSTGSASLDAGEKKELNAQWGTSGQVAGRYKAKAKIDYDGEMKEIEEEFNVGKVLVEIEDIVIEDFSRGEIAEIKIIARSYWSKSIDDVYASVEIFDSSGSILEKIESSHADIDALSTEELDLFWNTKDVEIGEYNAKASVYYLDTQAGRDFIIQVKEGGGTWIVLLIAAITLISVYIIWKWLGKKKK